MRLVAALAIAAALYYVYALDNRPSDIVLAVGLALFGVACRFLDWNRLLLVLACSQGVLIEENIRRSLMISRGDVTIFLARPITGGLLLVAAALVAIATIDSVMSRRRAPGQ